MKEKRTVKLGFAALEGQTKKGVFLEANVCSESCRGTGGNWDVYMGE